MISSCICSDITLPGCRVYWGQTARRRKQPVSPDDRELTSGQDLKSLLRLVIGDSSGYAFDLLIR